ncbi:RAD51-associated protein 1-like [Artemia franciscana]|uniref:RAD51-associated protein 1-like n=1 Tax=Artemia franciscana TaxID=6661 RepID=UPI0032DBEADB
MSERVRRTGRKPSKYTFNDDSDDDFVPTQPKTKSEKVSSSTKQKPAIKRAKTQATLSTSPTRITQRPKVEDRVFERELEKALELSREKDESYIRLSPAEISTVSAQETLILDEEDVNDRSKSDDGRKSKECVEETMQVQLDVDDTNRSATIVITEVVDITDENERPARLSKRKSRTANPILESEESDNYSSLVEYESEDEPVIVKKKLPANETKSSFKKVVEKNSNPKIEKVPSKREKKELSNGKPEAKSIVGGETKVELSSSKGGVPLKSRVTVSDSGSYVSPKASSIASPLAESLKFSSPLASSRVGIRVGLSRSARVKPLHPSLHSKI